MTAHNERDRAARRAGWFATHAPDRLRASGADGTLAHRVRLLGRPGPDRWDDPGRPGVSR